MFKWEGLLKMNKEKGITVVELLAAITITSIIGIVAYSVLFSGFSTYDRVKAEAELRDEADLIITSFINEMFTLKSDEIDNEDGNITNTANGSYLQLKDGTKIGFENNQPIIRDRMINISNDIRLTDGSKIKKL